MKVCKLPSCDNKFEPKTHHHIYCCIKHKRRHWYEQHSEVEISRSVIWQSNNKDRANETKRRYRCDMKPRTRIEPPMKLKSSRVLVCSDWHIPFIDVKLKERLIEDLNEVDHMIVAGDFMDCMNLSNWKDMQPSDTWDEEVEFAGEALDELDEAIGLKNVYFTKGNHEDRWVKAMMGRGKLKHLFSMTGRNVPNVSDYDWMTLEAPSGEWRICHPKNYSIIPGRVPARLASLHLCNIASAHGHHFVQGSDVSGKYKTVELGGIFDPKKLSYLIRQTTAHPNVKNGYIILLDDVVVARSG